MYIFSSFIILLCYAQNLNTIATNKPIVLLHGVASNSDNTQELADWLSTTFNRDVYNIEVGDGIDTSLMPMKLQLNLVCNVIYANPELMNGFDFIGMSQGGLLARGYVEYCNKFKVRNLITLVSPHGGVFYKNPILDFVNIYSPEMQDKYSFTNYWRNPFKYNLYLENSTYLAELNNEKESIDRFNPQYELNKNNIVSLENFVMLYSPLDAIVIPPQSGIFSLYDSNLEIIPLENTDIFRLDLLGLRRLKEENKLWSYKTNCTHMDHRKQVCFPQLYEILKNFLSV